MNAFVTTGGAGFIDSNLVDGLMADAHQVRAYDNHSTDRHEWIPHPPAAANCGRSSRRNGSRSCVIRRPGGMSGRRSVRTSSYMLPPGAAVARLRLPGRCGQCNLLVVDNGDNEAFST